MLFLAWFLHVYCFSFCVFVFRVEMLLFGGQRMHIYCRLSNVPLWCLTVSMIRDVGEAHKRETIMFVLFFFAEEAVKLYKGYLLASNLTLCSLTDSRSAVHISPSLAMKAIKHTSSMYFWSLCLTQFLISRACCPYWTLLRYDSFYVEHASIEVNQRSPNPLQHAAFLKVRQHPEGWRSGLS